MSADGCGVVAAMDKRKSWRTLAHISAKFIAENVSFFSLRSPSFLRTRNPDFVFGIRDNAFRIFFSTTKINMQLNGVRFSAYDNILNE